MRKGGNELILCKKERKKEWMKETNKQTNKQKKEKKIERKNEEWKKEWKKERVLIEYVETLIVCFNGIVQKKRECRKKEMKGR